MAEPGEAGQGVGESANRRIVTVALLLTMAVAALEQTVVSPAMPTIIAQLRGFDIFPMVFSAYLLAATVTTPLYGKLADRLGRKRVLLFGLAIFSLGSMLSGLAQSMPMLIGMRVVQGIGAGAVMPIVLTLLGDMYTLEQRARVQGLFSGVWGVSSLAGPALGGFLTDYLSWRWVFFVTIPFGVVAAWVLTRHVHETIARKATAPIDGWGAWWLALGSSALLIAVLEGSDRPAWFGGGLLGLAAACAVLFVRQERRAEDPILPLDLLTRPAIAAAVLGSFVVGGLLFGLDTYVPLYVQGVLGGSASRAGGMITPLFLSWSVSVAVAAKVVVRFGFRATAVVGTLFIAAGMGLMTLGAFVAGWTVPAFVGGMVVIGLGMGPTSLSYILSVQNAVAWDRRGVATGAVTFFRTIGGALGVGLLGMVLAWQLGRTLPRESGVDVAAALRPETHAALGPDALRLVRGSLGLSLRGVFVGLLGLTLLGLLCAGNLPAGRAESAKAREPEADLATAAAEF